MNCLMSREGMIPRNFLFIFIILLIILSSCGLYDSPYIEAPDVKTFTTGIPSSAEIYNRSDNDPEVFRGYEIYYKYYDSTSYEWEDDDKTIFQTSDPEPGDLTAVGYRRVNTVFTTEETTSYPMIPVDYSDRDSSFTLTVDFNDVSASPNVKPQVIYSGYSNITLYRNIYVYNSSSGDNEYKSFISDDNESSDADIPVSENTLSLYVFAYGKDDNVYNIYSKPVWLGRINF